MDSNNDDEERFLRMFSKQLAEALRAKDEEEAEDRERWRSGKGRLGSGAANEPNKQWERIRSTYSDLCHDDPIISGGDGDCHLLAKALIPKQKQYATGKKDTQNITQQLALSSRLVEGILQATSRAQEKAAVVSTTSQTNNNETKNNAENNTEQESSSSTMFSPSSITTAEGLAEIAFSIFAEGPYRCIQQEDNLQAASAFLGSFQPPDTTINNQTSLSAEEKAQLVDEATARIVDGMDKMAMEGDEDGGNTQTAAANDSANNRREDDASSSSSEFFHHSKTQGEQQSRAADDNDSLLQEVFADESDADDYEYESSYNPYSTTNDVQRIFGQYNTAAAGGTGDEYDDVVDASDFGFNPLQLSEPNATNQTWEGARKAIHCLLSSLTYGKLALSSLSSRTWSEGGMSETLADLSFMLLLENAKREDGGDNAAATKPLSLLHTTHHDCDHEEDILALWDRPLFILRDRALDKNRGHDALPAYLQLLTAFLSHTEQDVMSILSSPLSKKNSPADHIVLPPATTVGLSSLAAMCTCNEMTDASSGKMCGTSVWSVCPREEMKKAIVSSIGSLSCIVECVRPKKKSPFAKSVTQEEGESLNKVDNSPWLRTAICIIPIIEYLTNLQARFDFQPLFEGGGSQSSTTTLSDSDAKAISDSGLFRELLSMYTATRRESDTSNNTAEKPKSEEVARMQLLRTLFTLSTQSPELLGRYAVRVPDFVKEVHSSAFMDENLVDGILWTSAGSSLLENKTDTAPKPRLKLRANSKLKIKASPIEEKSLAERSIAGFENMCHSSKVALQMLKECLLKAVKHTMGIEEKMEYEACKYALGDIKRFSNCLSNCPSATTLWLNSLKNRDDSTHKATASIAELKATLASLPSFRDEIKEAPHRSHKKDDDDNEGEEDEGVPQEDRPIQKAQTLKQMRKEYGTVVASIRSSVKIIALALESQKGTGLSLKKGPISYNMSSKTD